MERALIRQKISMACKRLALTQQVVSMCELVTTPKQEEFLHRVLIQELAHRERIRRERLLKRAAFPVRKTLDDYEWDVLRFPAALPSGEVTSCNFVRMKRTLVLYGPVGTGKTHLPWGRGITACGAGLETRFFTAASLATKLDKARRDGTLEKLFQSIDRAELVILDEWGYLSLEKEQAQLLFQLISSCYERRSLIITTNLEFSKWGTTFTEPFPEKWTRKCGKKQNESLIFCEMLVYAARGARRLSSNCIGDSQPSAECGRTVL